jgi:glycosyltransferase involved in cell wall biosynthesis
MSADAPEVSVVIPVYNEEAILEASVGELRRGLAGIGVERYEVLLAENGSRDRTVAIAEGLAAADPRIRTFSCAAPNYGAALREGIGRARGEFVLCEEIDLCDADFHARALALLRADAAELVVGSKAMPGAHDRRPLGRRVATRVYNGLLRVTLGFTGTDTHGLKAFRRSALLPVVGRCIVGHDVFASELVIRAEREGVRVREIPVELEEKRAPSVRLLRRVPRVLGNLLRLTAAIHLGIGRGER